MLSVITTVVLFLLRLRFPSNKSLFSVIRGRYGTPVTKGIRKWERVATRLEKARLDEEFLRRCHTDVIIPKFLRFKCYRRNLKHSPVYLDCQLNLLRNEIDYKCKQQVALCKQNEHLENIPS